MRNAKLDRQLRTQSVSGLRRRLRAKDEKIRVLEIALKRSDRLLSDANTANLKLRVRLESRKEIKIPQSMLDEVMCRFLNELAQELTRRTLSANSSRLLPTLVEEALRGLINAAYEGYHSTFHMTDSFNMFVEENCGDIDFSFKIQNISAHRTIPKEVRKSVIVNRPDQRMYILDDLPGTDVYSTPESPFREVSQPRHVGIFQ